MATSALDRHPIAATVAGALVFAVVAVQLALAAPVDQQWGHALSHSGPAVSAAFLAVASRRLWPEPADTASRAARRVLAVGLVVFAAGQIVEAAGAFGYRGNTRVSTLARLHDVGVVLSPVGLFVILAGVVSAVVIAVAAGRGGLKSSTLKVAILAAAAVAVVYVVAGLVLGF